MIGESHFDKIVDAALMVTPFCAQGGWCCVAFQEAWMTCLHSTSISCNKQISSLLAQGANDAAKNDTLAMKSSS
jgi:hypothetical protein